MACGGSQARGRIRAVAAGLHYSHSKTGSEPCLQPTPQLTEMPEIESVSSWVLVRFVNCCAVAGTPRMVLIYTRFSRNAATLFIEEKYIFFFFAWNATKVFSPSDMQFMLFESPVQPNCICLHLYLLHLQCILIAKCLRKNYFQYLFES